MRQNGILMRFMAIATVMSVCWQVGAIEGSAGCVVLDAKASVFWRTAVSPTMTIPVDFPAGATAATLTVTGISYKVEYEVGEGDFVLNLPPPSSPETEDVYGLMLRFNDGSEQRASIACITGTSKSGSATGIRVDFTKGSYNWSRVRNSRAVLPIPYGMQSFTIDGEPVDAGLDGAVGWYLFRPAVKFRRYGLLMADSSSDIFETTLFGAVPGGYVTFR